MFSRINATDQRAKLRHSAFLVLALLSIQMAIPACNDPQTPVTIDSDYDGSYDPKLGSIEFQLETASGQASALRLVATEVRWAGDSGVVHAQVAILNASNVAVRGPDAIEVWGFAPREVTPLNADCASDLPDRQRCRYEYVGLYGEDGWLQPGESSQPIPWQILNPRGEGFAFRAGLLTQPAGRIAGYIFQDLNRNGQRDDNEPGIAQATVRLTHGRESRVTKSDRLGRYQFAVRDAGLYSVEKLLRPDAAVTPPQPYQVFILERPDGTLSSFEHADFGCVAGAPGVVIVAGTVFEDLNADGHRARDEPGIQGVTVRGETPACPSFAPIVVDTDEQGRYLLRLPACEPPHIVGLDPIAGFFNTTPNPVILTPSVPPGPFEPRIVNFGVAPAPEDSCPQTPDNFIQLFSRVYTRQAIEAFEYMLAHGPDTSFQFLFGDPSTGDVSSWDYQEEVRIHHRMFQPSNVPPGQPPVPIERWLTAVEVELTALSDFTERPDLYWSSANPNGLDADRWRAMDATYATDAFFDLQSGNDLQVIGQSHFVVIEDMQASCAAQRFKILTWQDLGLQKSLGAQEEVFWWQIKSLYK